MPTGKTKMSTATSYTGDKRIPPNYTAPAAKPKGTPPKAKSHKSSHKK